MPNCPICGTEYTDKQEECSTCKWNLTVYSEPFYSEPFYGIKIKPYLTKLESWAKNLWNRLQSFPIQDSRVSILSPEPNILQEKLETVTEECEKHKKQVVELSKVQEQLIQENNTYKDKISQLEEQLNQLQEQLVQERNSKSTSQPQEQEQLVQMVVERVKQEIFAQINSRFERVEQSLQDLIQNGEGNAQTLTAVDEECKSLNERITNLEHYLPHTTKEDSHYEVINSSNQSSSAINLNQDLELTDDERRLQTLYNKNTNQLLNKAIEVNATEDSVNNNRLGSQKVIFEQKRRGSYWIIAEGGYYYLVPRHNQKINQHSYSTVEILFECSGFQPGYSVLRLVKPAKVSLLPEGEQWELVEQGILEFS